MAKTKRRVRKKRLKQLKSASWAAMSLIAGQNPERAAKLRKRYRRLLALRRHEAEKT
jgi:hypothetical protein